MNLFRRFLFFFFGLAIGSVFVMFFFQRKGTEFCYLPNCRVLKDLRSKPLTLAESLKDYSVEQLTPLFHDGDIDFSRSDTHSACRTYIIKGERGSRCICLNGAAARKVLVGDTIIIMSYALMDFEEAKNFKPTIVF